jgi:hypothetical protein
MEGEIRAKAGLLLWRRLLRLRLFAFVFAATEDLLEEIFLLGLGWRLRGVGCIAVGRCVGWLPDDGSTGRGWRGRGGMIGVGSSGFVAADTEDLLDEVLRVLAHLAAGVDGRGAVEEGDVEAIAWAGGVDQKTGWSVDVSGGDAFGRDEGFDVGVLRELDRALHELGPDGSGRVRALQPPGEPGRDVGVVVVADPDDADKV